MKPILEGMQNIILLTCFTRFTYWKANLKKTGWSKIFYLWLKITENQSWLRQHREYNSTQFIQKTSSMTTVQAYHGYKSNIFSYLTKNLEFIRTSDCFSGVHKHNFTVWQMEKDPAFQIQKHTVSLFHINDKIWNVHLCESAVWLYLVCDTRDKWHARRHYTTSDTPASERDTLTLNRVKNRSVFNSLSSFQKRENTLY